MADVLGMSPPCWAAAGITASRRIAFNGKSAINSTILHAQACVSRYIRGVMQAGGDLLKSLGDRVRQARARRGMTRKSLARDSGVSERYLAQIETGQGNISILLLVQIARALDLPVQELLHEGPEPPVDLGHTVEL